MLLSDRMRNEEPRQILICHFTPMEQKFADDHPNGQVLFYECRHCGHTVEVQRDQTES